MIDSTNGFAEINTNACDEDKRELRTQNYQKISTQNAPSDMIDSYISKVSEGMQKTDIRLASEILKDTPYGSAIMGRIKENDFEL